MSYKLQGERKFRGLDIAIENRKGSRRAWKDPHSGESGSTFMHFSYGYIRLTEGTDGDHVDVYVGPNEAAPNVFIVNQMKKPDFKEFDEQKCMLGFDSADEAKKAYLRQYNDPRFFGSMKTMPFEEFAAKVLSKSNHGKKIAQEKDMPFTSKSQQRAAFAGAIPGFSKKKALEWAHETPNLKDLPDRAPAEKGKPRMHKQAAVDELLARKIEKVAAEDRVSRIADRVDDAGIGILAAPYAARAGSSLLGKIHHPMAQAASRGLASAAKTMHHYETPMELTGLAMVAPGVTHRVAKGIDKVLPKEKQAQLEKIAKELYPDYEFLTYEEQAKIATDLIRMGQNAVQGFRGARAAGGTLRSALSTAAAAGRGHVPVGSVQQAAGLVAARTPGAHIPHSPPIYVPPKAPPVDLTRHAVPIPEIPAAARKAVPAAATPPRGAAAAPTQTPKTAPAGRGRLLGSAAVGATALGAGGLGMAAANALGRLQNAQEESVAAQTLAPAMYQGQGRVF